jgi:hypothetical protein
MISRSDETRMTRPGLGRTKRSSSMKDEDETIEGTDVADEMDEGPARKVEKGRAPLEGEPAEISGAHQGDGESGAATSRNTMGHGEREATIGGAHQGQHSKG